MLEDHVGGNEAAQLSGARQRASDAVSFAGGAYLPTHHRRYARQSGRGGRVGVAEANGLPRQIGQIGKTRIANSIGAQSIDQNYDCRKLLRSRRDLLDVLRGLRPKWLEHEPRWLGIIETIAVRIAAIPGPLRCADERRRIRVVAVATSKNWRVPIMVAIQVVLRVADQLQPRPRRLGQQLPSCAGGWKSSQTGQGEQRQR